MGTYRPATFSAATRFARLVYGLVSRPRGWSFEAIREELLISERTLLRYIEACRRELVDDNERPLLQVVRRGSRRFLCFARSDGTPESAAYEVLILYFALTVLRFLEGTALRDDVEGLWERLYRSVPKAQQHRLAGFQRKFYAIPYAVKDYRAFDDQINLIVTCLVYQYRMRIDYGGVAGRGRIHELDPYTLAMYRGGLYLIGYSYRARKIIYLAVERIRRADKLAEKFVYPRRYSPEKYTEGAFGIIDGPEVRVELLLLNEETREFLSSRTIHPTQRFRRRRDGTTLLSMRVRGTTELASWILSLSPWVEVIRPRSLREEVAERLATAAALHREKRRAIRR